MTHNYVLHVFCRRNGISQDAGVHDSGDFETDEAAKTKLLSSLAFLRMHYDEIYWKILRDDGIVVARNGL